MHVSVDRLHLDGGNRFDGRKQQGGAGNKRRTDRHFENRGGINIVGEEASRQHHGETILAIDKIYGKAGHRQSLARQKKQTDLPTSEDRASGKSGVHSANWRVPYSQLRVENSEDGKIAIFERTGLQQLRHEIEVLSGERGKIHDQAGSPRSQKRNPQKVSKGILSVLGQLHRKIAGARLLNVLLLAGVILTVVACASSSPQSVEQDKPKQDTKKDLKAPLPRYEATLDPSDYDEEVELVQKKQAEEKAHVELQIPRDSTTTEEVSQLGVRIQVFSTSSIDEALKMKIEVLAKLPQDSVYVVYDPPVYKVRLGDFPTRYEASIKLSTVVDQGYPDAWIVPDNIVRRKVIQVPRVPGQ